MTWNRGSWIAWAVIAAMWGCGTGPAGTEAPDSGGSQKEASIDIAGKLQIIVSDDFEAGTSRPEAGIVDAATGEVYVLQGIAPDSLAALAQSKVRVRGIVRSDHRIEVAASPVIEAPASAELEQGLVAGNHKTLVIVADFLDKAVGCGLADVNSRLFGVQGSVSGLYQEISYGQLVFSGEVAGPFGIAASSTDVCNGWGWTTLADRQAKRAGYNLNAYQNIVYVFPRDAGCDYAGSSFVNGNRSINEGYCTYGDVFAHELGHNLGFEHAGSETGEYTDLSDIMGAGYGVLRQVNAPHRVQMGWYDAAHVLPVNAAGLYTVAPLEEDPLLATDPQILEIPKPDTGDTYYLSYRQPLGYDVKLGAQWMTGLAVHHYSGTGLTRWRTTLIDGGAYDDPANGLSITQIAHDGNGVTVQIDFLIDSQAPSIPGGLAAAAVKSGKNYKVNLTWNASTDDVGVTGYDVLRDGGVLATAAGTSFSDSTVKRGTTYTYTARARDEAGNVSGESAGATVAVP